MPVTPTYPGLYIEELPSSARAITAAPTSITVFVGYVHPFLGLCAENGKWGQAIRIFSFTDYERQFGGLYQSSVIGPSHVAYAVNQFFLNGGADGYVVGLQPKYYGDHGAAPITPAYGTLGPAGNGIKFTSRRLTDMDNKVTVTVRNARPAARAPAGAANDTADLVVAFSTHVETYRAVNLNAADPINFIEQRLKGSQIVTVSPDGTYPTAFTFSGAQTSIEIFNMDPPDPAVVGANVKLFDPSDFEDVFKADAPLDKVEIFNILVLPGVENAGVLGYALAYCEAKRAFLIMDPPINRAADDSDGLPTIEEYVESATMVKGPNAALYFPYLKMLDPVSSTTIEVPPSGYVAGIYARTDNARGVWKAPAGLETTLLNTTGVVDRGLMTDMRQGTLNPLGVNVVRSFPDSGTVIWGARTSVGEDTALQQWRYVPVRRTALFIEQTLLRNLGWVVFEPNDEPLWSAIRTSIEAFMLSLYRQQAFQGSTPSQAFVVKCDATTTQQVDIDNGIVNILVGFRPLKPAEFVIIQIQQLAGQLQS